MGAILVRYGEEAYDHEGYAAQVLTDGTITTTYNDRTRPRMIGQVVAACDCGWTGATRYPCSTVPFDAAAEALALAEWETTHAIPVLQAARRGRVQRLGRLLSGLASEHAAQLARLPELPAGDRVSLLDRTQRALTELAELVAELREQAAQDWSRGAES